MTRFDTVNFSSLTSDGKDRDDFSARYKNMRYNLQPSKTIVLTVADASNLPGLAEKHLADKDLWWVLLSFNGLYDPIEDVKAGLKLRIPARRDVIAYLETTSQEPSNVII